MLEEYRKVLEEPGEPLSPGSSSTSGKRCPGRWTPWWCSWAPARAAGGHWFTLLPANPRRSPSHSSSCTCRHVSRDRFPFLPGLSLFCSFVLFLISCSDSVHDHLGSTPENKEGAALIKGKCLNFPRRRRLFQPLPFDSA